MTRAEGYRGQNRWPEEALYFYDSHSYWRVPSESALHEAFAIHGLN